MMESLVYCIYMLWLCSCCAAVACDIVTVLRQ